MTEPASRSGPLRARGARPRIRFQERLKETLSDPVEACAFAVACIPVLALGALGGILWRPLGIIGLLWGAYLFRHFHREVQSILDVMRRREKRFSGERRDCVLLVCLLAVAMSIPLTQVFFANDLRAMAAPTIAAVEAETEGIATAIPEAIYGVAPNSPSYGMCETVQRFTTATVAWPCYSTVGYLRLWQMSSAVVMMMSISLLVVGLPLALLWHVRSSP
ncbi:hypothetical protein M1M07_14140 [Rhodococcus sp. HM1]|uniref:hypothetical protein n=1 Tax=Rhodococcus sp. HM1 TaxID=2937759 RepID=UPI00200B199C|nr:hypothetical protein [Rhodococcus sp. HM1]MCK8672240.1 hypothetical protein [Rhodococcus sp. HM1]